MRTRLRSKVTLLFMTLGMLLAIPAVAFAADVVSDVNADLSSSVSTPTWVAADADKNFQIKVWATGTYNNMTSTGRTGEIQVVKNYSTTQDTATSQWNIVAGTLATDKETLNFENALLAAGHNPADTDFNYSQDCTAANFPSGLPQGCPSNPFIVNAKLSVGTVPDGTVMSLTDAINSASRGIDVTTDSTSAQYSLDTGYVKVDAVDPTIDLRKPLDGDVYNVGDTVYADFDCADTGGSGVTSCVGTLDDGDQLDTSTPGSYQFTVNAEDNVGNTASVTHNYTVVSPSCSFSEIRPPINDVSGPTEDGMSSYKYGAKGVIPAKFQATCDNSLVDTQAEANDNPMTLTLKRLGSLSGGTDTVVEDTVVGSANTGSLFRFDDAADQYIYNINIKGLLAGVYSITISDGNGGSHTEWFAIK